MGFHIGFYKAGLIIRDQIIRKKHISKWSVIFSRVIAANTVLRMAPLIMNCIPRSLPWRESFGGEGDRRVFDLNKSDLCFSFVEGLAVKGLGPSACSDFPYWTDANRPQRKRIYLCPTIRIRNNEQRSRVQSTIGWVANSTRDGHSKRATLDDGQNYKARILLEINAQRRRKGPLLTALEGFKFLAIAIEHSTKWVEAKPLTTKSGRHAESLTYGSEAIIPIAENTLAKDDKRRTKEATKKKEGKEVASIKEAYYQNKLRRYHNDRSSHSTYKIGDFVLLSQNDKGNPQVWQGPHMISELHEGYKPS
ncbi:hypothetical protein Tco_1069966 [Tanacetum coccineum]|uniref:Uncharacterized protein n=1 Tax=Tanacetum coccineum TaxID=301880 RepID=A0ABQ5HL65_9ASTR